MSLAHQRFDPRASMMGYARQASEDLIGFSSRLRARKTRALDPALTELERAYAEGSVVDMLMAYRWLQAGLQRVVMPHTYAAALMATDCHDVFHCKMPWPAFEIVVPGGLVVTKEIGQAVAMYAYQHDGFRIMMVFEKTTVYATTASLAELAIATDLDDAKGDRNFDVTGATRAVSMLKRLLFNTCLCLNEHRESEPATAYRAPSGKRGSGDPAQPITLQLGKPLSVDCRKDIRDYISGVRKSEPSVTTLVRGHWRNQVHGPGNSLRRLRWIQPFYRGHGPMLVRPTRLGFSHAEAEST